MINYGLRVGGLGTAGGESPLPSFTCKLWNGRLGKMWGGVHSLLSPCLGSGERRGSQISGASFPLLASVAVGGSRCG